MEAEQTGQNPVKAWAMDLPALARPGKPGRLNCICRLIHQLGEKADFLSCFPANLALPQRKGHFGTK